MISAPGPKLFGASCTITACPVFFLVIQRRQRQKIDHLCLDSVLFRQLFGGVERSPQHRAIADQGDVPAVSYDLRFADRQGFW